MRSAFFEDHSHLPPHLHTCLVSYRSVATVEMARVEATEHIGHRLTALPANRPSKWISY